MLRCRTVLVLGILVLSMPLALFSGGVQESSSEQVMEPQEKITITWMKWGSPSGVESRRDLLFSTFPELGDKYILEPNIGGKKPSDIAQKLRLSMSANADIGDIVSITYPMLKEFATTGVLDDLTPLYDKVRGDVIPAAIDAVSVNGRQYAFPNQLKPKLWFYRKDMFDAAGIDPAKVITTDDFIAAGLKLQQKYPDSYIWNLGPNFGSAAHYNLGMLLSGTPAKFWDEDAEAYVVDTDPYIRRVFEDMRKIYRSGVLAPINDWTPDWEQGFANDTIASSLIAIWFRDHGYIPKWAPEQKGKWAVAEWPEIAGSVGGSNEGAGLTVIPVTAKHPEAAKEIMSLLYLTTEGSLAHYQAVPTSHPNLKSALESPIVQEPDSFFGASLISAINSALDQFKLPETTPATDKENQIMNLAFQRYVLGNESLDTVLREAKKELDTQIGNPYELF